MISQIMKFIIVTTYNPEQHLCNHAFKIHNMLYAMIFRDQGRILNGFPGPRSDFK